jgi:hypothetical protein
VPTTTTAALAALAQEVLGEYPIPFLNVVVYPLYEWFGRVRILFFIVGRHGKKTPMGVERFSKKNAGGICHPSAHCVVKQCRKNRQQQLGTRNWCRIKEKRDSLLQVMGGLKKV